MEKVNPPIQNCNLIENCLTSMEILIGKLKDIKHDEDIEFLPINEEKTIWLKATYNEEDKFPIT